LFSKPAFAALAQDYGSSDDLVIPEPGIPSRVFAQRFQNADEVYIELDVDWIDHCASSQIREATEAVRRLPEALAATKITPEANVFAHDDRRGP
jgi:hypothetical protein